MRNGNRLVNAALLIGAGLIAISVSVLAAPEHPDEEMVASPSSSSPSPQGIPSDGAARRSSAKAERAQALPNKLGDVRSFDGSNNNLADPEWGATFSHLQRLAPVGYSDGISSMGGVLRPGARTLSNALAAQGAEESWANPRGTTDFLWQWGQFIDHDLDLTDGAAEAADIAVPRGDVYFDPQGSGNTVIPFHRALHDLETGTARDNPRQQENEITSWLDGSMVYGSSLERAAALRSTTQPALLATSPGDLLPFNSAGLTNANGFVADPTTLFLAGDVRANEQVGLAVMHTLFVREHNRLATQLLRDDPDREPDAVFEAVRRLVIAKIQIITFEEWLPALVGHSALPPYRGYDPRVDPTIYNEFSAAAFRLGHSMLNETLWRLDRTGQPVAEGHLPLASAFFAAPSLLTERDSLDPYLRGMGRQVHQEIDNRVVNAVRNFLFGPPGAGGLDLAALNIQRGRDHGLASYNDVREALGLARHTRFSDITEDVALSTALEAAYGGNIDEVDLWVGGLAEDPVANSHLGEVFQKIVIKQFAELRAGDRFWYQSALRPDELDRVRGTRLSQVIRDNTGIGSELQDNVFVLPQRPPAPR